MHPHVPLVERSSAAWTTGNEREPRTFVQHPRPPGQGASFGNAVRADLRRRQRGISLRRRRVRDHETEARRRGPSARRRRSASGSRSNAPRASRRLIRVGAPLDCHLATVALGTRTLGHEATRAAYAAYFAAFPDLAPNDEGFAYGDDVLITGSPERHQPRRVARPLILLGLPPGLANAPCSLARSWRIGWVRTSLPSKLICTLSPTTDTSTCRRR